MATNIPPHNLGEVVDALCALIHNPNATVQELMEHMPGPDFPTGGRILGTDGILEAYRTGHGRLTVRGKAQIEQLDQRTNRSAVIITEIPYQANKAALVEKIAELVNNKVEFIQQHLCFVMCAFCFPNLTKKLCLTVLSLVMGVAFHKAS
jgi:DNA gyrase subunit A